MFLLEDRSTQNFTFSFLPLTHLELCLINTYPLQGEDMKLPSKPILRKVCDLQELSTIE